MVRYDLREALQRHESSNTLPESPASSRSFKLTKRRLLLAALALVVAVVAFIVFARLLPTPTIPPSIRSKLTFQPFIIQQPNDIKADASAYTYDASLESMSFVINNSGRWRIVVSERATPQEFVDIPDVYTKLTDNMNRYYVFQNRLGTIYLTRPDGQSGQTAIMNTSGVLLLAHSAQDLSIDDWRKIFSNLQLF